MTKTCLNVCVCVEFIKHFIQGPKALICSFEQLSTTILKPGCKYFTSIQAEVVKLDNKVWLTVGVPLHLKSVGWG